MDLPPTAWQCLQCPEHGRDPKADLAARKHEKATGHGTLTHLDQPRSGWCVGPLGAKPPHGRCKVPGCRCECHEESAA